MAQCLGQHATVIGGSLAGLMTARVLADHFDAVTVLERDPIDAQPGIHKSIPRAIISTGCCWADSRSWRRCISAFSTSWMHLALRVVALAPSSFSISPLAKPFR